MCWTELAEFSKSMIAPVTAVIAVYIAWQQWGINSQKLKLDLYDRRLAVYEEVKKLISIIISTTKPSSEELIAFRTSTSQADFLFDAGIVSYLDELYQHGFKLRTWNLQYRDSTQDIPEGYDHNTVVDGMDAEVKWFSDQIEPAKQKFLKYLKIEK